MRLLLDTHILLWALTDDERLSEKARELLEDEKNEIYYSLISLWEIQIKCIAHPAQMNFNAKEIADYCKASGFQDLPLQKEHIFRLSNLIRPETAPPHKDPFDRILVCQAAVEHMLFVTHDSLIPYYKESCICGV